jgi:hypothetical protein
MNWKIYLQWQAMPARERRYIPGQGMTYSANCRGTVTPRRSKPAVKEVPLPKWVELVKVQVNEVKLTSNIGPTSKKLGHSIAECTKKKKDKDDKSDCTTKPTKTKSSKGSKSSKSSAKAALAKLEKMN